MSGDEGIGAAIAPALREDLRLHAGSPDADERYWLVYDPVAHRYHELDEDAFGILQHWREGMRFDALAKAVSGKLGRIISPEELADLAQSLDQYGLLCEPARGWRAVYARQQQQRRNPFSWLLHNYLFIRVPLVKPDAFLKATLPVAQLLATPLALGLLALIGFSGLYLASRQWDAFSHTFLYFFSIQGAAGYLGALVFVKIFHELGHAYVARYFGCRVPTMGVAFLVLVPVLYTDVTDAWKLPSRRSRLLVSSGGMLVELALAGIATFIWAIVPDGTLRSACFFVATTSLVMSLVINLSPLMRFDGYYLLSDYWRIPNLQPRAFALMRWQLRELLFGLRAVCPEEWPRGRRSAVIFYAIIVCIYRLFLFIGIALLVYHMTVKILGILLFAVEIIWFVLRPVVAEIRIWWDLRHQIMLRKCYLASAAAAAAIIAFVAVPWPHHVVVPAVLEPVAIQRISAPVASKIVQLNLQSAHTVKQGDVLAVLDSPELRAAQERAATELALAEVRRDRRVADQFDRDQTLILNQEIASLRERLAGLSRMQAELTLRAVADGVVEDIVPDLHTERWVGKGEELGIVVADVGRQVRGYINEPLLSVVSIGARGQFIPDEPLTPRSDVELSSISTDGAPAIDLAYLTSTHSGDIAVNEDKQRGSVPVDAQYQVVMAVDAVQRAELPVLRGVVRIAANPESYASRTAKRAIAILIRESGF